MELNRDELIALRMGQKQAQRSGDYWAKEELEELSQMFHDGCGFSELALYFSRNEVAIYQQLSKLGLLSAQCKPRSRRAKVIERTCLCPFCAVPDCKSTGRECFHAGTV